MGHKSTLLIVILVFGVTFAMVSAAPSISKYSKQDLLDSLKIQRASADIARTIKSQNICMTVNPNTLDKYPAFVQAIKDADDQAQRDIQSSTHYGNYYSGVGIDLNKTEMLSLAQDYDFNQTITNYPSIDKHFFYQDTMLQCGFEYNSNSYSLMLVFTTLENVTGNTGYYGIDISKQSIYDTSYAAAHSGNNTLRTYASFNNTIVVFNELPSTVTIELTEHNGTFVQSITIPANRLQDVGLNPAWNTPRDVVYHYMVNEYPSISGDIIVAKAVTYGCMDIKIAESLYHQSNFDVLFPSYLPKGFSPVCNLENTNFFIEQIYANQTAADNYKRLGLLHSQGNPYTDRLYHSMSNDEIAGLIIIYGQTQLSVGYNAQQELYRSYQQTLNDTNSYWTEPQFFTANGTSYFTYHEGKLSDVDVATNDAQYRVFGALPISELIKVAESLG